MQDDSLNKYSREALSQGYIVAPFVVSDSSDLAMKSASLSRTMSALYIDEFTQRQIIDRLTYTRDYGIKQSINFMVISKNENGKPLGIANFVYSKSSGVMYLKDFVIAEDENVNKRAVLALLAVGARDHMREYDMYPKAVIISPSLKHTKLSDLSFMDDLKMKFMTLEPKTESGMGMKSGPAFNAEVGGEAISVFPIKKDHKVEDIRIIMVHNYGTSNFKMNSEVFSKFLKDLKDEDDLSLLLKLFKDQRFKITLTKINETHALVELLNGLSHN